MKIDANTSLETLFKVAKDTLQDVEPDQTFIVRDLFRGFEWNRIAKGNRTKLGAMFLNFAENEGHKLIKSGSKTPQNQQRYTKL